MIHKRLRSLAATAATVSMVVLGWSKPAPADILITISDGSPSDTQTFDSSSNMLSFVGTLIGNYSVSAETVITNYPGNSFNGGSISTSVNISGTVGTSAPDTLRGCLEICAA